MISLLFVILAGICNSVMDTVQFRYRLSYFSKLDPTFWNPKVSWKNKWKDDDIKNGEKFFGSSTFLVFVTDIWHLAQFLMLVFFSLAIVFYKPVFNFTGSFIVEAFTYHTVFGLVFELFWNKIWRKR